MADAKVKKANKYRYLRLPLASAEEAEARRQYLIGIGTITPHVEKYACDCVVPVTGPYCSVCGSATVVWR